MADQLDIFGSSIGFPQGFKYEPELISRADESRLVEHLRGLPFRDFEFQGYAGKRRVISFGWKYDFGDESLRAAEPIPDFLLPVRERAAAFAGSEANRVTHTLITEYPPGASIGWHRDRGVFDQIIGVSLVSPCLFRLRRKRGDRWERTSLVAVARSAYLLGGAARTEWEHSIPPVDALRYSITFRTLRNG
jgi:alkylated DNA repair dioxygenase AlkB